MTLLLTNRKKFRRIKLNLRSEISKQYAANFLNDESK
jgi:hypothetical protein